MKTESFLPCPRRFIRCRGDASSEPLVIAAALREALAADGVIEVYDEVAVSPHRLAFTLHARGHAVIAWTTNGQHLGTFADALAGVQHAFRLLDRMGDCHCSPRRAAKPFYERAQEAQRR